MARDGAIMAFYKLAIFDFDGTLADSLSMLPAKLNQAAARFGFRQVSDDEFTLLRGRGTRDLIRDLGVPMWKIPTIAAWMRRMAAEDAGSQSLFPGADALLRRLHDAGVGLAVVSSNSQATVIRGLGPDSAALLSHYECGTAIFGKAAKFRKVLRRADLPGSSVIAIGDEARDIEAAHEAGVDAGAVTWGFATPDLLLRHKPEILFNSMSEIGDRIVGPRAEATNLDNPK
jgi:phosphoglycolate phosphatase